jgi:LysM repeat protein
MKTYLSIFLFVITSYLNLFSQEKPSYHVYQHEKGDTVAIFGDKVNVRIDADKEAKIADQLYIGQKVIVLKKTDIELTLADKTDLWYQVSYGKDLIEKTGYIWGGVIAIDFSQLANDIFVLNFIASKVDTLAGILEIRAARDNKMISSQKWNSLIGQEDYVSHQIINLQNLENYSNTVTFSIGYPACGYPQREFTALWDGKKLLSLPMLDSMSDGGFFFSQTYKFPEDQDGSYNRIMLAEERGTPLENEDYGGDYIKKIREVKWNGKAYILPVIKWED